MPSETPFRIALAIVFLLATTISAYHRIRAAAAGDKISHREEGCLFAIVLRLAGVALGIVTAGYLLFPASVAFASLPLPAWLRWSCAGLGGLSLLLLYWTLSTLGKNLTDTVVVRASATLVTRGPYRVVRHPFYVCAALLMASVSLLTANLLIAAASVLVLALLAARTPKEEQMLIARFGQQYRDYMAATGRFFPRLWR